MTFSQFLRLAIGSRKHDISEYSQKEMLVSKNGQININQLLRFEQLTNDWDELMSNLNLTVSLPVVNASKHHDYRQSYNVTLALPYRM